MSRISEKRAPSTHLVPTGASHHSSSDSDHTLAPGEGPFDFEKALQQTVRRYAPLTPMQLSNFLNPTLFRLDESDIKRRELGVVFDDLRVVGLGASANYQPTVGSTLNPFHIFDAIKLMRHPPVKDILTGFEGCVKPGEMLCELPINRTTGETYSRLNDGSGPRAPWRWLFDIAQGARQPAARLS